MAACAPQAPSIRRDGVFPPGAAIVVNDVQGDIDAFAPERGQPADRYTVAAYEPNSAQAVSITLKNLLIDARATSPGVRFLVRGPAGATMNLSTNNGSIMVADFEGTVNAHVGQGNIKMLIPQYGNASIRTGNISVIFASTDWPGTLHFSAQRGNIELYVNENAKAHVRMHTDNGTVYSDFPLRGTSRGNNETIDAPINGGGPRSIDVEVATGSIRLMQLKPQI